MGPEIPPHQERHLDQQMMVSLPLLRPQRQQLPAGQELGAGAGHVGMNLTGSERSDFWAGVWQVVQV